MEPRPAYSAVANSAARRPNRLRVVPHSRQVTPSMNASDSSRAAVRPPRTSARPASGG
ncbi:MAG TPA: hypothetical protein VG164_16040 [Trebonia sp.]|nr:hypothetical protein [Trebonia sp.]